MVAHLHTVVCLARPWCPANSNQLAGMALQDLKLLEGDAACSVNKAPLALVQVKGVQVQGGAAGWCRGVCVL